MARQLEQLDRSTVETWMLGALGILSALVKMTWGWELALFATMYAMVADLTIRSPWTIKLWWPAKLALAAAGLALLVAAAGDSITEKFYQAAPKGAPVPLPIEILTRADYYLDRPRVYLLLSVIVVVLVFWRFAPVSRFRHRALFLVRRSLAEKVWISRDAALKILMESRWAAVRRGPANLWLRLSAGADFTHEDAMFRHWCNQALDYFAATERHVQGAGQKQQFDETALRQYLDQRYDEAVRKKFGDPY